MLTEQEKVSVNEVIVHVQESKNVQEWTQISIYNERAMLTDQKKVI